MTTNKKSALRKGTASIKTEKKHSAPQCVIDQRKRIADAIAADIETNASGWVKDWCASGAVPFNPTTKTTYHGRNQFILSMLMHINGWNDPRFVTYASAKKNGWQVKHGEKAVYVEKWTAFDFEKSCKDGDGNQVKNADGSDKTQHIHLLRCTGAWPVFNAAQVDGMPYYEAPKFNNLTSHLADSFIKSSRCKVNEIASDSAFYSPLKDSITVPLRGQFGHIDGFIRTLIHEMAHSTTVPLNRKCESNRKGYAFEEMVAELISMFVAADCGLDADKLMSNAKTYGDNSETYIKEWATVLRSNPDELFKAASKASNAADYIIDARNAYLDGKKSKKTAKVAA